MKIQSRSGVCFQGELQKYTPPFPLLSQDQGLSAIGYITSIGNLIVVANSVTVSYFIHNGSLLQNVTALLLQNATKVYNKMRQVFMTKCYIYYNLQRFYYKMR